MRDKFFKLAQMINDIATFFSKQKCFIIQIANYFN